MLVWTYKFCQSKLKVLVFWGQHVYAKIIYFHYHGSKLKCAAIKESFLLLPHLIPFPIFCATSSFLQNYFVPNCNKIKCQLQDFFLLLREKCLFSNNLQQHMISGLSSCLQLPARAKEPCKWSRKTWGVLIPLWFLAQLTPPHMNNNISWIRY